MMSLSLWSAFAGTVFVLAISPGPGAASVMGSGMRYGYQNTLKLIAGLQVALCVQLTIVALGLGAMLIASSFAFETLKIMGALYLIWLGIKRWKAPVESLALKDVPKQGALFLEGVLVNLTNPKAIVFMAALLPQFIDPSETQWVQFLMMALTMCLIDTFVMSCYALFGKRLRTASPSALRVQNRLFGGVFMGLGTLLLVSRQH